MKREISIKRFKWGHIIEEKEFVADEKPVELIINKTKKISFPMSPEELKAFAYGYLLTTGMITSRDDVAEIEVNHYSVEVQIPRLNTSPSGELLPIAPNNRPPFETLIEPDYKELPNLYKSFTRFSNLFDETGGIHYAASINDVNTMLYFSEDVGRLNVVDKVIGKTVLMDTDLYSGFYSLMLNGKITGDVVTKSFMAGIRSIVSLTAPTSSAVAIARKNRVSLIGFLRGKTFNIYV